MTFGVCGRLAMSDAGAHPDTLSSPSTFLPHPSTCLPNLTTFLPHPAASCPRSQSQHRHVLWAVQCPRVFHVWRKGKMLTNFGQPSETPFHPVRSHLAICSPTPSNPPNPGEFLTNFFGPMFDATRDPKRHPELAALLSMISCIDTVDNEVRHARVTS